jgi:hypothetical protein
MIKCTCGFRDNEEKSIHPCDNCGKHEWMFIKTKTERIELLETQVHDLQTAVFNLQATIKTLIDKVKQPPVSLMRYGG